VCLEIASLQQTLLDSDQRIWHDDDDVDDDNIGADNADNDDNDCKLFWSPTKGSFENNLHTCISKLGY